MNAHPCLSCYQTVTGHEPRCTRCTRLQRAKYGHAHQQLRTAWTPLIATGTVTCSRYGTDPQCLGLIPPDAEWDLDHINGRSLPAHAACNRRAGGQRVQ